MKPARRKKQPSCFVYMLASTQDGTQGGTVRSYVGWTLDVERRLAQHNAGRGAKSTRGRRWIVIHVEICRTRRQAMRREWHLKRDRALRKILLVSGRVPEGHAMLPRVYWTRTRAVPKLRAHIRGNK